MADPITSNLEVDVPEIEVEMESHLSLLEAVEEYIQCVSFHRDSTHTFSTIKQHSAQYETQRRINELEQFCEEYMPDFPDFMKIVSSFLEVVDIDEQNSNGLTALMLATIEGHTEIVDILIEAGADLNIQEEHGDTALMKAIYKKNIDIAEMLIDSGADLNIQNVYRDAPLIYAIKTENTDIAKLLIDAKADLNIQDFFGNSALIKAIQKENIIIAQMLIENGACMWMQKINLTR